MPGDEEAATVDGGETEVTELSNFTNDSAMMIAHERALETSRPDALFRDPFAKALAGDKGETLSKDFGDNCSFLELPDWPEFHKTWTAVRTKFIDDAIAKHAATGSFPQLVNLGAGMDARAYRLECYKAFANAFDVDMEVVNAGKARIFKDFLGAPSPHCGRVHTVSLDFLDGERTLATELTAGGTEPAAFDVTKPTVFVSEGLIMYLGLVGKLKLIRDVSAVAVPGSVFVLQFSDASERAAAKSMPQVLDSALSVDEARTALTESGWGQLEFFRFGDETLNYGRFPTDRFGPQATFSFVVCVKE